MFIVSIQNNTVPKHMGVREPINLGVIINEKRWACSVIKAELHLNYPGLPSGVLGCPRISVGGGDGMGFGFRVGDRGLGTS